MLYIALDLEARGIFEVQNTTHKRSLGHLKLYPKRAIEKNTIGVVEGRTQSINTEHVCTHGDRWVIRHTMDVI